MQDAAFNSSVPNRRWSWPRGVYAKLARRRRIKLELEVRKLRLLQMGALKIRTNWFRDVMTLTASIACAAAAPGSCHFYHNPSAGLVGTRARVASSRYCASLAAALLGSINSVDLSVVDHSRYRFGADHVEEREEH